MPGGIAGDLGQDQHGAQIGDPVAARQEGVGIDIRGADAQIPQGFAELLFLLETRPEIRPMGRGEFDLDAVILGEGGQGFPPGIADRAGDGDAPFLLRRRDRGIPGGFARPVLLGDSAAGEKSAKRQDRRHRAERGPSSQGPGHLSVSPISISGGNLEQNPGPVADKIDV